MGAFAPLAAKLDLGKRNEQKLVALDNQEMSNDPQSQFEKEHPDLNIYCQREQATSKKDRELWVWIGFTLATPTEDLTMNEVLALVRAKVERLPHQDWTSEPDPSYGFGEIEIIDYEVSVKLLILLKSPNYNIHFIPAEASHPVHC